MEICFWVAVIGSGLIALWRFLFGSSTNHLFGVVFDDAPSLNVSPALGEHILCLMEFVTVFAVAIIMGRCADIYIVGSCVEPLWRLIACFFLGIGGTLIYVIVIWECIYYIFYFVCVMLFIVFALIDEGLGWLFEKLK